MSRNISLLLKEKRLALGIDIERVSEILKIRSKYLEVIEENSDTGDIPSPVYMLGYLKNYADFLELNGQEIIAELKASHSELAELNLPAPYLDDNKPNILILTLSFFLLIAIFFTWQKMAPDDDITKHYNSPISQSTTIVNDNNYLLAKQNLATEKVVESVNLNDYKKQIAKDTDHVILVAKEASNIKIINNKGKVLANRLLSRDEIYTLPYEEGLVITVSKKDAVQVFNKGRLLKSKFSAT
jgi:cytoskeletal protein RodZ